MMMMEFAVKNYGIQTFRAKIGESNTASLNLFRKLVSLSLSLSLSLSRTHTHTRTRTHTRTHVTL